MPDTSTSSAAPFATSRARPQTPGLSLRHFAGPEDFGPMNGVANAVRAADGMDFYTTNDQFRLFYESLPTTDLRTDIAIVELEGRIVGYGRTGWKDEPGGTRIYEIVPFLDTAVADEAYELLVAALEERVRAVAADHPPGARLLETFGGDKAVSREGILKRLGYEPVRHFYSMLRPTLDDLPDAPLPPGLEIRDVTPEHLETIWAADIEAFRDSWGFTEPTDQDREVFMHDPVMSDTTLWRVAWDGDEVAGQVRSYINAEENERFGRLRGYTEHISVRRPWRRRGLARALIVASFELLRARGMTEAALGVDTENESGALRVYEGVGFRPVNRSTTYRKPPD